jgi:hypothetical protein
MLRRKRVRQQPAGRSVRLSHSTGEYDVHQYFSSGAGVVSERCGPQVGTMNDRAKRNPPGPIRVPFV